MRNLFRITASVIALLILSGCQKESDDDAPNGIIQPREWYEIIKTDTLTGDAMITEFSDIIKMTTDGPDMVRVSFYYHSMSDTTMLTLSGCTCWPVNAESCSEIWLEDHYTSTDWAQCPSQTSQPGMIIASSNNAIFIGADYQGLGYTSDLPHPYFNSVVLAQQNADCFKAAIQVIKDFGPDLDDTYHTYNYGYSLGGSIALALVRITESDPELKRIIHLKKSYCGGGPYDQTIMMRNFLSQPDDKLSYPVAIPLAIKSIFISSPTFRARYSEQDFFTTELLESGLFKKIEDKQIPSHVLNDIFLEAGFNTVRTLLREEIIQGDCPAATDLYNELSKLDLTQGWTPTTPILFYHSKADKVVPIECVDQIKDNMPDNPNITYLLKNGAHVMEGLIFFLSLFYGSI